MIQNSMKGHKALEQDKKQKVSKREVWNFVKPYFSSPESKQVLRIAMTAMIVSKLFSVGSPYCLKIAVNALSGTTLNMNLAYYGVIGFASCRAMSVLLQEGRNNLMAKYLRDGIK